VLLQKLKQIVIPIKFERLINNWLINYISNVERIKFFQFSLSSLFSINLVGSFFLNVLLNNLISSAYFGFSINNYRYKNLGNNRSLKHCIIFSNSIIFICHRSFLQKIIMNISKFLMSLGLQMNEKKTRIIFFKNKKVYFDYLGFRIYYIPFWELQKGFLIQRFKSLSNRKKVYGWGKILINIAPKVLLNIKKKLKFIIRFSYNLPVLLLIKKLNFFIEYFRNYYSWCYCYRLLSWLDFFVFKRFFLYLSKKFKKFSKKTIIASYFQKIKCKQNKVLVLSRFVKLRLLPIQVIRLSNILRRKNFF
jgi:hypothetical protein